MIRVLITFALFLILAGCSGGITEVTTGDYDSLIKSGWDAYNQNNFSGAQQEFEKAIERDNTQPEGYIGSGWAQLRLQKPFDAIVSFRDAFDYITTVNDSVDALCGYSGAYLAAGKSTDIIDLFKRFTISTYDDAFPFRKHDYTISRGDLEVVQAMAFYRLGMYSPDDQPNPDNAVYHLNQALYSPYVYTNQQELMGEITDYLGQSGGGYF